MRDLIFDLFKLLKLAFSIYSVSSISSRFLILNLLCWKPSSSGRPLLHISILSYPLNMHILKRNHFILNSFFRYLPSQLRQEKNGVMVPRLSRIIYNYRQKMREQILSFLIKITVSHGFGIQVLRLYFFMEFFRMRASSINIFNT